MSEQAAATLIGDIVDSRLASDRGRLDRELVGALKKVFTLSPELNWVQKPEATVGDEFQAVLKDRESAVMASLLIRLTVLDRCGVDTRYGIGFGRIQLLEDRSSPMRQDGPGWWSARSAIERAKQISEDGQTNFVRTWVDDGLDVEAVAAGEAAALNAFLIMRDEVIDRMKPPARNYLLGLLRGRPQTEIAKDHGVTQSNVSQTLARSGAYALKLAHTELVGGQER